MSIGEVPFAVASRCLAEVFSKGIGQRESWLRVIALHLPVLRLISIKIGSRVGCVAKMKGPDGSWSQTLVIPGLRR